MEAVAKLRNCPTAPRKMRLVVDMIRSKGVEEALAILKFSPKEASIRVEKLLLSAIANWQQKNDGQRIEDSELFVKTVFVDGGYTLKRFRPAPQGRATKIRKRSNHVTIIVDSKIGVEVVDAPVVEKAVEEKKTTKAKESTVKKETKAKTTTEKKEAAPKKETKKAEAKVEVKKETKKAAPKKAAPTKDAEKKEDKGGKTETDK